MVSMKFCHWRNSRGWDWKSRIWRTSPILGGVVAAQIPHHCVDLGIRLEAREEEECRTAVRRKPKKTWRGRFDRERADSDKRASQQE